MFSTGSKAKPESFKRAKGTGKGDTTDDGKSELRDSRHMACLMPCTFAVYEADDGSVRIAKMNTGLMGRVFGGTVARIMGGKVGPEETRMLQDIVN